MSLLCYDFEWQIYYIQQYQDPINLQWEASLVVQTVKYPPAMQETLVQSLGQGQEDPLEKGMVAYSSTQPGEFHGQKSLVGYTVHGVAKSQIWLGDFFLIL